MFAFSTLEDLLMDNQKTTVSLSTELEVELSFSTFKYLKEKMMELSSLVEL